MFSIVTIPRTMLTAFLFTSPILIMSMAHRVKSRFYNQTEFRPTFEVHQARKQDRSASY